MQAPNSEGDFVTKHYDHPHMTRYRMEQRFGMALLVLIIIGCAGQVLLAVLLHGLLFGMTALTLLALVPFVLMLLSVAPPVTLDEQGILIHPWWWSERRIAWDDVLALKPYPLLPQANQETERRALQGRRKYQPAVGIMLVVRGLPWQYRCAGFFAGEHSQPVIALTSRTHRDYSHLVQAIEQQSAQRPPLTAPPA